MSNPTHPPAAPAAPARNPHPSVLFAPDWRDGVPYQTLLADALARHGVEVRFPQGYRRVLPLARTVARHRCDLLHLHWPEAYYMPRGTALDSVRKARYPLDLALATHRIPLVLTAHNLKAHDESGPLEEGNTRFTMRHAKAVIAHGAAARDALIARFNLDPARVRVIPHGDLSASLGAPLPRDEARHRAGFDDTPVCLFFGAIQPYKGLEPLLGWWRTLPDPKPRLLVAGQPKNKAYGNLIRSLAQPIPSVTLHLERLPDPSLHLLLSAADCALFNYAAIFTSGAAPLARAYGLPLLLPRRLDTVDLDEPHPLVHRFDDHADDFARALRDALRHPPDYAAAAPFRDARSWDRIAGATAALYRSILDAPTAAR